MTRLLRFLIVGQVPPPYHGSNVMTKVFNDALDELGWRHQLVNKRFSLDIAEVGRFRWGKIFRFARIYYSFLRWVIVYKPDLVVYFISSKVFGLIPDAILIGTAHLLGKRTLLYVHGRGHQAASRHHVGRLIYGTIISKVSWLFVLDDLFRDDVEFLKKPAFTLPNCLSKEDCEFILNLKQGAKSSEAERIQSVVFMGNLLESKGVLDLVKSIPLIISDVEHVRFEFLGAWTDEAFRKRVEEFIREHELTEYVSFPGPIYGDKKYISLFNSDIFAFPTSFDAFPLVNIEAMACSLPVVSTEVGAIPSIVEDGETGFIVPPHDTTLLARRVVTLIKDAELRKQMGDRGREKFLNTYTFEKYKSHLDEILFSIQGSLKPHH